MTPQRRLGSSVAACLAGAALVIYGATRVWSVQVTERPGLTSLRSTTTGAAEAPWLVGLALVALAGAGALLATRGLPRRLLGVLLTIVSAGLVLAAVTGRVGLDPGAAGASATFWPIACVLGGGLVGWGGVSAARHGHLWPIMGSRYERRPAGSTGSAGSAGLAGSTGSAGSGSSTGSAGSVGSAGLGAVDAAGSGDPSAAPGGGDPAGSGARSGSDQAASDADPTLAGSAQPPSDDQSAMISSVDTRAAWDALDRGDDPTIS